MFDLIQVHLIHPLCVVFKVYAVSCFFIESDRHYLLSAVCFPGSMLKNKIMRHRKFPSVSVKENQQTAVYAIFIKCWIFRKTFIFEVMESFNLHFLFAHVAHACF